MNNKLLNNKTIKILIPIIVLLVLLIIAFIYLKEYQSNNYRDQQDKEFYQYYAGQKVEYEATISYNKKEEIKSFVPKVVKIDFNSRPVYYKNEKKVIFLTEMNVIFPMKNQFQAKSKEFSYIEKNNNINYLVFEDYKKNLDQFILFDGDNLYFFSDSTSFTINNETIKLSPMSYIVVKQNEIYYYDYENDYFGIIETSEPITITNNYYDLNVTYDYLDVQNSKILLVNDVNSLKVLD